MKKQIMMALLFLVAIGYSSCTSVEPNYEGVLMENYGRNGKEDFSLVKGRVWTAGPGTKLFQVPLWEQRASFSDNKENQVLHLKSADNTEFSSKPVYSFKVIEKRAIDVVFENKQLDSGDDFMKSLEDNILENKIYDLMKEESRKYTTDTLMANGGSLRFEESVQKLVATAFQVKGLELINFSCQLDFSEKVKARIDTRNEVNTNVTVLDQQIIEQKKRNELATLQKEYNQIESAGLTPQILTKMFIEKWDGQSSLYGTNMAINLLRNTQ